MQGIRAKRVNAGEPGKEDERGLCGEVESLVESERGMIRAGSGFLGRKTARTREGIYRWDNVISKSKTTHCILVSSPSFNTLPILQ